MKKSIGVVHAVAKCQDCEWEATGYKNAQAIGARHARLHHHFVKVEVTLACEYDGRE